MSKVEIDYSQFAEEYVDRLAKLLVEMNVDKLIDGVEEIAKELKAKYDVPYTVDQICGFIVETMDVAMRQIP